MTVSEIALSTFPQYKALHTVKIANKKSKTQSGMLQSVNIKEF